MVYVYEGKVALVTGGTRGIGLACVRELLSNGVKNVSIASLNELAGRKISKELGEDKVHFVKTDVTKSADLENAFKQTISKFGKLDIVINNAGIFNEENWELMISINVTAVARGTVLAFDYMGKDKGGNGGIVINTASILGLQAMSSGPVYSGSKHFVVAFTRSYGTPFYFNKTGVKILAICPGVTITPLIANASGRKRFAGMSDAVHSQLGNLPEQTAESVGRALITAINLGENGSAWVVEGDKPVREAQPAKPTLV